MTNFKKGDRVIFTCQNGKEIKCEFSHYWQYDNKVCVVISDMNGEREEYVCTVDKLKYEQCELIEE